MVVEAIEGFCDCAGQALLEVIAEAIVIYARWKWRWWFANSRPMRLILPLFKRGIVADDIAELSYHGHRRIARELEVSRCYSSLPPTSFPMDVSGV